MLNNLKNLLFFLQTAFKIVYCIIISNRIFRKVVLNEIKVAQSIYAREIDLPLLKRMKRQTIAAYPLSRVVFKNITGKRANPEVLVSFGAMSGLLDDCMDKNLIESERLFELIKGEANLKVGSIYEHLLLFFHQKCLGHQSDKKAYLELVQKTLISQEYSMKQFDSNISVNEVEMIIKHKGADSLWMMFSLHCNRISPEYKPVIDQAGFINQFLDDIVDWHEDTRDGISTMVSFGKSISDIEVIYTKELRCLISLIKSNPKFQRTDAISLFLIWFSLAYVAFYQFKLLESKYIDLSNVIGKLPRKEVIIDMDKVYNVFRWFIYYLKSEIELVH